MTGKDLDFENIRSIPCKVIRINDEVFVNIKLLRFLARWYDGVRNSTLMLFCDKVKAYTKAIDINPDCVKMDE